jgi:hypothetical protein
MIPDTMPLGPFMVGEGGHLAFRDPASEPAFSFLWHNRCFAIRLHAGHLACAVPAGRLPSSTGGTGRRETGVAFLRSLGRLLPEDWRMSLLPDHRIQLETNLPLEWPANIAALIAPIFHLVTHIAPVLDALDEAGLA